MLSDISRLLTEVQLQYAASFDWKHQSKYEATYIHYSGKPLVTLKENYKQLLWVNVTASEARDGHPNFEFSADILFCTSFEVETRSPMQFYVWH